jgi:hypothetical protein
MSSFSTEVFQNEYLPIGGSEVNAIMTVTSGTAPTSAPEQNRSAVIVMVDTSGSMSVPRHNMNEAKKATAAAIGCVGDGTLFGVIAGNDRAKTIYPRDGSLAVSSAQTREDACQAVARLKPDGGTRIGWWLERAREMFEAAPDAIRHAILLTDGQDEHETREELESVLAECEGVFQCDCRGVGADWEVEELRRISSVLLGTVDIVAEPEGLEADFLEMMESAMGKAVRDVSLRVWTPQSASVAFLKQVSPTIEDLTGRATTSSELVASYPTGAWGVESREYHLCIRVAPHEVGEEMLAGRVSVIVDGEEASQALVRAIWTDDEQLSTRINRQVAHYTGQAELAQAIQEGLKARKDGDVGTAAVRLGRAVQLAAQGGNDETMKLLEGVVEVENPATGAVRLKDSVQEVEEMALDTRSTKTMRVQPDTGTT